MRVTLEISFSFKHEVDTSSLEVKLPEGASVISALREFVNRYPHLKPRLFTDSGEVQRYINALINGGNVAFKKGFLTILHDGDHLTLLPPVGGG